MSESDTSSEGRSSSVQNRDTVIVGNMFDPDGEFIETRVYENTDRMFSEIAELDEKDWFGEMRHQPAAEVRK